MIDIHSHIIWGIDDGSKSREMTLNMLRTAEGNGTKTIIATPHYFRGTYDCEYEQVKTKVRELNELVEEKNINIQIVYGQEVYYSENIMKYYLDGEIGTLNDTRYMLIELPMDKFSVEEVIDNLYELIIQGVIPVIAHPERYRMFIKEPILINKLIKEGYLFQLNAGSVNGYFGKDVKRTAEIFINNRIYNFIGSDAHRDIGRVTNMKDAIAVIENLKIGYSRDILMASEKLLNNADIKFFGKSIQKKKKGIFSFFRK